MIGRRPRPQRPAGAATARRRSGPAGEERWWDPSDQAFAERPLVRAGVLGQGWGEVPMVNNAERLDPLGHDDASEAIREARADRQLTALDEGRAWRRRKGGVLLVLRVEVFAEADDTAHRGAWRDHGEASLDATWRERWRERDRTPGWIEARWLPPADRPDPLHAFDAAPLPSGVASAVDWLRVEDHTGERDRVTFYEHLTVWRGRVQVVATIRRDLGLDLDRVVADVAVSAYEGAAGLDTR